MTVYLAYYKPKQEYLTVDGKLLYGKAPTDLEFFDSEQSDQPTDTVDIVEHEMEEHEEYVFIGDLDR